MAVVTTNLGVVTAYGDAVAAGYTGTKAEWQELMASYATVAEEAAQSATDAETAKNAAVTAKTAAETAKTDAIAAKTAAQTAQGAAEDAAQDAEDSAESIAASASQIAQNTSDIEDLKEDFNDLEAKVDRSAGLLNSDSEADLDIADLQGNVILRLADGEIETKNFKSSDVLTVSDLSDILKTAESESDDSDFNIADPYGNVLARMSYGEVETKNFRGYKYRTYKSDAQTYTGSSITLTINHQFRKGDRVVIHVNRGQRAWDYGAIVNYYAGNHPIKTNWRGDSAHLETTIQDDCESITAIYPTNSAGMPSGSICKLEVSVLGDIPITPTIVRVAKDGTGDFNNLKDCIEYIGENANDVLNPYVIEIYPGTYNTLDGFTDAEINSADIGGGYNQTSFVGIKLLNGVSLIGKGTPEEIILTASLDGDMHTSAVRGNISTLNLQGTGRIENLTVIAENIRYCVHDDFYSVIGMPKRRTVKNCIFRGYNVSGYHPNTTYGAGCFESGGYYEFENCDFGENAGLHTSGNLYNPAYVRLKHCVGHGFRIGDNATANIIPYPSTFVFDNCNFQYIHQNMVDSVPHVVVRGTGNTKPLYQLNVNTLYITDDVQTVPNVELQFQGGTGTVVERRPNGGHGPLFYAVTALSKACGIVIYQDADITCIQTRGYVRTDRIGLTSFSLGDYVGLNGTLASVVNSADLSFGRIEYIDNEGKGYVNLTGGSFNG